MGRASFICVMFIICRAIDSVRGFKILLQAPTSLKTRSDATRVIRVLDITVLLGAPECFHIFEMVEDVSGRFHVQASA